VSQAARPESLRDAVQHALAKYFEQLDGTPPDDLYHLVMQQVEQPLLETVMSYTGGNQSRAAAVLGISRSTLRKKLAQYDVE
jgi:Fis family transcriptional regulator